MTPVTARCWVSERRPINHPLQRVEFVTLLHWPVNDSQLQISIQQRTYLSKPFVLLETRVPESCAFIKLT